MRFIKPSVALFAAIAVTLLSAVSFAQQARDIIESRTLDNGLDVVAISSPTLPIVTVELTVKNGAFTEPPELNGLSHLYEHMFFKGNAVIPNQEAYLKRMRQLGIVFNGTTSTERVNYYFTLPSDNLKAGLEFMRDAITTPQFDEAEFEKEKQVVLGEIDRNESNPYYWFSQAVSERVWHAHPTRKDPLGDRPTVIGATVEQMQKMKERYYVPNNSALFITGDVDSAEAFRLAESIFGGWERGPDPFVQNPIPEHPPIEDDTYFVLEKEVDAPLVQFTWHGPSVDDDPRSTYAADVLSFILGQPASTFQKNLKDTGLVLGVSLSYYTQRHTGPISLTARIPSAKLDEAIPAILTELEKVTEPDYFTDEQLASAKTILAVDDLYGREKLSSFTHTVSFWWATAGLDYYLNYIDDLGSVTRGDITRYVERYIAQKPFVAGALMSANTRGETEFSPEKFEKLVESRSTP